MQSKRVALPGKISATFISGSFFFLDLVFAALVQKWIPLFRNFFGGFGNRLRTIGLRLVLVVL